MRQKTRSTRDPNTIFFFLTIVIVSQLKFLGFDPTKYKLQTSKVGNKLSKNYKIK